MHDGLKLLIVINHVTEAVQTHYTHHLCLNKQKHYDNTSNILQILMAVKNENFQMQTSNILLSFAQNIHCKSTRKAMNRNWSNQKANPALKTKTGKK